MNERSYLDVISGRRHDRAASAMRVALSLLSPMYGAAVFTRNWLFRVGFKRTHAAGVPVVSVGNVTTGGTGKTPVVAWVAEWFQSQGGQPCLVSRGYHSLDAGGNDELRVLQQLCPGVPHVQDRDRVAAAQEAVERHAAKVIVLDDGFQHWRLHRDVDIVLIDATNPWGYGHLLPRGLLREPRSALRRADVVVLTRVDQVDEERLGTLRSEVRRETDAPVVEVAFRPTRLQSRTGETASVGSLAGQSLLAFCGIGNPEGFRRTLNDVDVNLNADTFVTFADHHHYSRSEFERLVERANACGASALVTTQKDLVKLDPAWSSELPVWAVVIGVEIVSGREAWEAALMSVVDGSEVST